ncbi:hypothetical protein Tco_0599633 [Tanacetum coccineum]
MRGCLIFTNKWSLDELAYGVPTDGPYQTNPPSLDDIISYIRIDREGQVRLIRHEEEIDVHEHQILTREIVPTLKPLEEIIWENTKKDRGTRRGHHSTSSSSAFDQPSSSHLNDDDDDDGNGEGTSRASTNISVMFAEQVFAICKCAEDDKVKLELCGTFEGRALTWWMRNGNVHTLGLANANTRSPGAT